MCVWWSVMCASGWSGDVCTCNALPDCSPCSGCPAPAGPRANQFIRRRAGRWAVVQGMREGVLWAGGMVGRVCACVVRGWGAWGDSAQGAGRYRGQVLVGQLLPLTTGSPQAPAQLPGTAGIWLNVWHAVGGGMPMAWPPTPQMCWGRGVCRWEMRLADMVGGGKWGLTGVCHGD